MIGCKPYTWMLFCCLLSATLLQAQQARQVLPVKTGSGWGLINTEGKIIVETRYDAIGEVNPNGYTVVMRQHRCGLLAPNGEETIPCAYDRIYHEPNNPGYVRALNNKQSKLLNLDGRLILEGDFDAFSRLSNGLYKVHRNGLCGLWDSEKQRWVLPQVYSEMRLMDYGGYLVQNQHSGKWQIVQFDGSLLCDSSFDQVLSYADTNYYKVSEKGLWGLIDRKGKIAISIDYQSLSMFDGPLCILLKDSEKMLYHLGLGKTILQGYEDFRILFGTAFIVVYKKSKRGLARMDGKVLFEPLYDELMPFGTYLRAKEGEGWGLVDTLGNIKHPFDYQYIGLLDYNVAIFRQYDKLGILNEQGKKIIPAQFDSLSLWSNTVKVIDKGKLSIYKFNDEGNLTGAEDFEQFRTIKVRSSNNMANLMAGQLNTAPPVNATLEDFEWVQGPGRRWGLINRSTGKVVIDYMFESVEVFRDLGFTVVKEALNSSVKFEFDQVSYKSRFRIGVVNNKAGKFTTQLDMVHIFMSDFTEQKLPVARVIFTNGRHGLINKFGRIVAKDYVYIDEFRNGMARATQVGALVVKIDADTSNAVMSLRNYLSSMNHFAAFGIADDNPILENQYLNLGSLFIEKPLWGVIDTLKKVLVPFKYNYISDVHQEHCIVKLGDLYGMQNIKGQMTIPIEYAFIDYLPGTDFKLVKTVRRGKVSGCINTEGVLVLPTDYQKIIDLNTGIFRIRQNELWGYASASGTVLVKPQFKKAEPFSENMAAVFQKGLWGFINTQGELVIPPMFSRVGNFSEGKAWVMYKGKYGFINPQGTFVIEPAFADANDFHQGLAVVKVGTDYGLLQADGTWQLKPKHRGIAFTGQPDLYLIKTEQSSYFLYNALLKKDLSKRYIEIGPFENGLAVVRADKYYGVINAQGEEIVVPKYNKIEDFVEGVAIVQTPAGYGFINALGREILAPEQVRCLPFNEGVGLYQPKHNRSVAIDTAGQILFSLDDALISAFSDSLYLIRDKTYKFYYADADMHALTADKFEKALPFQQKAAPVSVAGRWTIMNRGGMFRFPPKYNEIEAFEHGFALVNQTQFLGVSRVTGQQLAPAIYEYIEPAGDNLFRLEYRDKTAYLGSNGEWLWNPE